MTLGRIHIPLLLAAIAVAPGACGGPSARAAGAPAGKAPGIVLFCIDTLRDDELDLEGDGGHMPSIAAFAKSATAFRDASSPAAWTPPAVASILTGLLPSRHGVRGARTAPPLARGVATLAGTLRAAGWSTSAVTGGGWVSEDQGFAAGFEGFHTTFDLEGADEAVRKWKESLPADRPFFLFLHTIAAHDPYGEKSPRAIADPVARARAEERLASVLARLGDEKARASFPLAEQRTFALSMLTDPVFREACSRRTPRALTQVVGSAAHAWCEGAWADDPSAADVPALLRAAYESGLSWADLVVSRTLAALDRAALPEGTVVAVVADHGEAFGEHGALLHGTSLHDEIVRVPFLLRAPGRLPAGPVDGSCSLVDVTPTLLDLAGLPVPAGLDGRSLLPLARGQERGRPVLAEADRLGRPGESARVLRVASVRTDLAKYLVEWDARTTEVLREVLYDLTADPGETNALPVEDLGRFGTDFCIAVGRLRATFPGLVTSADPRCGATLK